MKKTLIFIFLIGLYFLTPIVVGRVQAASLRFGSTTATVVVGQTVQVPITVDAGTEQIRSVDVYVLYDATLLEAQGVAEGSFFPTVTKNITSGKVYIAGLVDDPASSKTGSGILATITFKGLANGVANVTFDCRTNVNNSSKIIKNDMNATNIITCSQNGALAVTVGTGSSSAGGTTPTVLPTQLPQTGIFDNIKNISIPGAILIIAGSLLQIVLLII